MSVAAVKGNIVLTLSGQAAQLTSSGVDAEPVLSPNGSIVVFTRKTSQASAGACTFAVAEERELWAIGPVGEDVGPLEEACDTPLHLGAQ